MKILDLIKQTIVKNSTSFVIYLSIVLLGGGITHFWLEAPFWALFISYFSGFVFLVVLYYLSDIG